MAPRHAAQGSLRCYYIDSLEDQCPDNSDYQHLVIAIRTACGTEAARIGVLQPAFYSSVSDLVRAMLAENEERRREERRPKHLLLSGQEWSNQVVQRHQAAGTSRLALAPDDVEAVTGYLHDAGQIFDLRRRGGDAVLIDQDWATDLIYEMLRPGGHLARAIRNGGGLFDEAVLNENRVWQSLDSDSERQLLLDYMRQCGILIRLVDRQQHREGKDVYLATEKWLLPPYAELERRLEWQLDKALSRAEGSSFEEFAFAGEPISEFDFRALMVHLGGVLGARATWFRDGLQAVDDPSSPQWCFQVRWQSPSSDDFLGLVQARLVAPKAHLADLAGQVEEVLAGEGSPFTTLRHGLRRATYDGGEAARFFFRDDRDSDYDLAVSSSGRDAAVVEPLVAVLRAAGLRVAWYRLDVCRAGENAKVMKFMSELRRPPCLLLFLSDGYLRDDPEKNWYCVWELADAINQIVEDKRTADRTLVIYSAGGALNSLNINQMASKVFRSMAQAFDRELATVSEADKLTFEYYHEWASKFRRAAGSMHRFFQERGTLGTYSSIKSAPDGSGDYSSVIADVRRALGSAGALDAHAG